MSKHKLSEHFKLWIIYLLAVFYNAAFSLIHFYCQNKVTAISNFKVLYSNGCLSIYSFFCISGQDDEMGKTSTTTKILIVLALFSPAAPTYLLMKLFCGKAGFTCIISITVSILIITFTKQMV